MPVRRARKWVIASERIRADPDVRGAAAHDNRPMTPPVLETKLPEQDPALRWRIAELERAGYTSAEAIELGGRADVDLHVAIKLLRSGCPVATAMRILR